MPRMLPSRAIRDRVPVSRLGHKPDYLACAFGEAMVSNAMVSIDRGFVERIVRRAEQSTRSCRHHELQGDEGRDRVRFPCASGATD